MTHHTLEPEVAGSLGPRTVMDTDVHPPAVTHLHYEVDGWLGDDLLESFPCFLISPQAALALRSAHVTGFADREAEITLGADVEGVVDLQLTNFRWLTPTGVPGVDDLAVDRSATLIVSDQVLEILHSFHLSNCDIEVWVADPAT
jgi:hypothetical protein